MSTVTPRRAETLEESSERRVLFCLWVGVRECGVAAGGGGGDGEGRVWVDVLLAVVCCRHGGRVDVPRRLKEGGRVEWCLSKYAAMLAEAEVPWVSNLHACLVRLVFYLFHDDEHSDFRRDRHSGQIGNKPAREYQAQCFLLVIEMAPSSDRAFDNGKICSSQS